MKQIAEALIEVQKVIKPAIKEAENEAFKRDGKASKYADLSAIWEVARKPLTDNGLCVIQTTDFDESGVWLKTTLLHKSGETIEGRFPLRPTKPDMQGMGSAMTYARRYGLSAILGIVADIDDDGNAASDRKGAGEPEAPNRKTAATAWANTAIATVRGFQTGEALTAWMDANTASIQAVRPLNETAHRKLMEAIQDQSAKLSTLAAG